MTDKIAHKLKSLTPDNERYKLDAGIDIIDPMGGDVSIKYPTNAKAVGVMRKNDRIIIKGIGKMCKNPAIAFGIEVICA